MFTRFIATLMLAFGIVLVMLSLFTGRVFELLKRPNPNIENAYAKDAFAKGIGIHIFLVEFGSGLLFVGISAGLFSLASLNDLAADAALRAEISSAALRKSQKQNQIA